MESDENTKGHHDKLSTHESSKLDREKFSELFSEPVKSLGGKGASWHPIRDSKTPGMNFRREAAQKDTDGETSPLDSGNYIEPIDPLENLKFVRPGVQHGVYKNLRLGKYKIQSRLDLHGYSVERARVAVKRFLSDCTKNGARCALITHGKGEGRKNPAILKSCINHWLKQLPEVLAFHSAQKYHGGLGSTYVLIRKSERAREVTAKSHQNRGKQF